MAAGRKTLKETKAEYRSYGFCDAHGMAAELMRDDFWRRLGGNAKLAKNDPRQQALVEVVLLLDKRASELDTEYKRIMYPRVYGREFDDVVGKDPKVSK